MPSLELTPAVHYGHSPPPPQPLQHPISPDSVLLKMEAVHSFKTSEHISSTWHINPKDNHQLKTLHTYLTPCLLSAFKCLWVWSNYLSRVPYYNQQVEAVNWYPLIWFVLQWWWWTLLHLHGQILVVDTPLFFFLGGGGVIFSYTSCIIHLIPKYLLCRQAAMLHVVADGHVTFGTRRPCYIW